MNDNEKMKDKERERMRIKRLKEWIRRQVLSHPDRPIPPTVPDAFRLWYDDNDIYIDCPQGVNLCAYAFTIWTYHLPYEYKEKYIEKEKLLIAEIAPLRVQDSHWCIEKEKELYKRYGLI